MKHNDDLLRAQIDALIRDEIQDDINEYVEHKEDTEKQGLGFVEKEDEKELKVNVSKNEIDKLIKEYKKIKKGQKSNLGQIRKMDKRAS